MRHTLTRAKTTDGSATTAALSRLLTAVPAFMLRDFCVIQLCRLSQSRSPVAFGMLLVALAYGVPSLLLTSLDRQGDYLFLVLPGAFMEMSFVKNVLPAVLQAGIAVYAVVWRLRGLMATRTTRA